jgi:hypothetical protein
MSERPTQYNPEINIAIAILKGWTDLQILRDDCIKGINPNNGALCIVPNWSGNIAAAMSLFFEFPNPNIKGHKGGGFTVWATAGIDFYSADSLSVAICLAWLGWMEGNKS